MKTIPLARALAVPMAVALAALGFTSAARAANTPEKLKAKEMTCQEFLALGTEVQPRVIYWLDGFSKSGKSEDAVVDVDTLEHPIAMVVAECHKTPKDTLLHKVEKYF